MRRHRLEEDGVALRCTAHRAACPTVAATQCIDLLRGERGADQPRRRLAVAAEREAAIVPAAPHAEAMAARVERRPAARRRTPSPRPSSAASGRRVRECRAVGDVSAARRAMARNASGRLRATPAGNTCNRAASAVARRQRDLAIHRPVAGDMAGHRCEGQRSRRGASARPRRSGGRGNRGRRNCAECAREGHRAHGASREWRIAEVRCRAERSLREKNILRRDDARETTLNPGFKWEHLETFGLPAHGGLAHPVSAASPWSSLRDKANVCARRRHSRGRRRSIARRS